MTEPTLSELRGEIDRLDDQLVDLLLRRTDLVRAIGSLKGADGSGVLRPGREAEILRRLLVRAGAGLDGAAVVRIFREIVSAAVRQQGPFSVAASMPEGGPSCWGLARDQYGAGLPIRPMAGPIQVVAAVAEGSVSVGVVPYPVSEEAQPWWPPLMAERAPRVVARLPAADGLAPAEGCEEGLALAMMVPEPSGDDRSLIGLETEEGLGRSRIGEAFATAGLNLRASWRRPAGGGYDHGGILAEVDGFVMTDGPAFAALQMALGAAVSRVSVIGAYAVPPDVTGASTSAAGTPGDDQ
ncbi:MAG: chorismate mutase [Alphaproteobacteria bacterium]|nr:chorismate mutase [Alphaproteobacteria bacterium]